MLPAQPNKSLINGMNCLQALVSHEGPVGCSQLAEELGLSVTQVNRLLKTLAHMGFVHQISGAKYEAGPGVHVIAAQSLYGSGLLKAALGPLETLVECNVVIAFGVLWQQNITYFYHRKPGMSTEDAISGHRAYPATSSVLGHILLAELPEERVRAMYGDGDIPSFSSVDNLLKELARSRKQGYGIKDTTNGGKSISMAVGAPACAAVALSGIPRDADLEPYVLKLQKAVGSINDNLTRKRKRNHEKA